MSNSAICGSFADAFDQAKPTDGFAIVVPLEFFGPDHFSIYPVFFHKKLRGRSHYSYTLSAEVRPLGKSMVLKSFSRARIYK